MSCPSFCYTKRDYGGPQIVAGLGAVSEWGQLVTQTQKSLLANCTILSAAADPGKFPRWPVTITYQLLLFFAVQDIQKLRANKRTALSNFQAR
jgi:hypothetical protein